MDVKYRVEFHDKSREIFFNGDSLGRLNSYEMKVFSALYAARPNAVEKDELIKLAWAGKIVTNNSLNVAIRNIRIVFLKAGLNNVIITHTKVGFSWNTSYTVIFAQETSYDHPSLSGQLIASNEEHISVAAKNIGMTSVEAGDGLSHNVRDNNCNTAFSKSRFLSMFIGTLFGVTISIMFDVDSLFSPMIAHKEYHDSTNCIICNTFVLPSSNKYAFKSNIESKGMIDTMERLRIPPFYCGRILYNRCYTINLPHRFGVSFTPSDNI